ncbi:MAG TPA: pilin [Candidatus Saccharimonadales bacterium]|nr:pilin [Candidatus Saccharimonadales bacterium]
MRRIIDLVLIVSTVAFFITLLSTDAALAIDGAAQTETFIRNIVKTLVGTAGAVAVIFIVLGGFKYMTSSGHPQKLESAKRTLLYAGIGLVIVLAAYSITDLVANVARSSFGS